MSSPEVTHQVTHRAQDAPEADGATAPAVQRETFEVRRRVVLSVALGAAAAVVAVAYLVRATGDGGLLEWAVFALMAAVAVAYGAAVLDARAPLLVADRHGVRLRRGRAWSGVAWPEVEVVEHLPRRGLVRDGWILVGRAHDDDLTVPLSLSTRLVGVAPDRVSEVFDHLADGRAEIVEIDPALADPDEQVEHDVPVEPAEAVGDAADVPSDADERFEEPLGEPVGERADDDQPPAAPAAPAAPEPTRPLLVASSTPAPLRESRPAVRAEVEGATALRLDPAEHGRTAPLPEVDHLRRGDDAWDLEGDHDEPLGAAEVEEFAVVPAADPVIGPQLAGARTRLGLTVDQVSERTRIRPHVIEAIEVDDFAPCGGDFYARGHLRTLTRILGVEAAPLLAEYDERYADAPIDPRRVFAAELATARGGGLRATRGPSWSVLVAVVMAVVLVWSIARLVMEDPAPASSGVERINASGGVNNSFAGATDPVPVVITAAGGGARVVARDGAGEIVFDGQLAFNQSASFRAVPPVRVSTTDGSLELTLDGDDRGAVGTTGQQAQQTFVVR